MLKEGLLWFDDDSRRSVSAKIRGAIERYQERFGVPPTLCCLNPTQLANLQLPGVTLVADPLLGRNYFLIGHDADQEALPLWEATISLPQQQPTPIRGTKTRRASA